MSQQQQAASATAAAAVARALQRLRQIECTAVFKGPLFPSTVLARQFGRLQSLIELLHLHTHIHLAFIAKAARTAAVNFVTTSAGFVRTIQTRARQLVIAINSCSVSNTDNLLKYASDWQGRIYLIKGAALLSTSSRVTNKTPCCCSQSNQHLRVSK
jgi:hypothetical protein